MPFYRIAGTVMHLKLSGKGSKNPPKPCCAPIVLDGKPARCADISTFLCDWDTGPGTTCDAPLCAEHAHQIAKDRHLCPEHAARRRAREPELFE